jgi:hypothetical protein
MKVQGRLMQVRFIEIHQVFAKKKLEIKFVKTKTKVGMKKMDY